MIDYATLTPEAIANMSDEEFSQLDVSKIPNTPVSEPAEEVQQEVTQEPEPVVEQEPTPTAEEVPNEGTANGDAEHTQAADTGVEVTDEAAATPNPTASTQQTTQEKPTDEPSAEVTPEKAFFDKVTAEFNANGKSYKIENAEDVTRLMQMGLNYHQKMAAMKPNLKLVKALNDAGISSVDQLGHLLDLHAKKPEAIAKLVQDSGLDTYEFEEQAKSYVPTVPNVNDATINFELVAQELESNPNFGTLVQHMGNFDEATKKHIFENPDVMRTLTDHIAHGYFDKIVAQYDVAQSLGRTRGMSFLQAYEAIGQQLFGQQQQQQVVPQAVTPTAVAPQPVPVPVATKTNTVNNTARQAAASVTSTASSTHKPLPTPKDIWEMSDEEFAALNPKDLKQGN